MTNKEVYKFSKVLFKVNARDEKGNIIQSRTYLRKITREMCRNEIITKAQRDWLNGQILKMYDGCESNHYILGARVYK